MKFRFKGLDRYINQLERLSNPLAVEAMIMEAVKEGADIVADRTKAALRSLPVDDSNNYERKSIRSVQKAGLINNFGISPFQDKRGFINVKTGFDNYNKLGQANVRVARQLESGTSRMPKNPVISRATRNARKDCFEAMQNSLDKAYKNIMK